MRKSLERVPIPGGSAAEERALQVVTRGFAELGPPPAQPRAGRRRTLVAFATSLGLAAAIALAVAAAGSGIVHSVRQAVGLRDAAPVLTRLPAGGPLLVSSAAGPWVVQPDGSKRLLGGYREASWSPHGLFLAVTRRHELLAVDPVGNVHWSLARAGAISLPRWAPDGYRIAYLDGSSLRIVAGDGSGDRLLVPRVARIAPAWRPSGAHEHVLAFVTASRQFELIDVDTGSVLARRPLAAASTEIAWSYDAERVALVAAHRIAIFDRSGRPLGVIRTARPVGEASFEPGTHRLTVALGGARSDAVTFDVDRPRKPPVEVFSGSGRFSGLAWAPNGRWLLLAWPTADQWLFVPAGDGRITAVAGVAAQFSPGRAHASPPTIDGWCCLPDLPA